MITKNEDKYTDFIDSNIEKIFSEIKAGERSVSILGYAFLISFPSKDILTKISRIESLLFNQLEKTKIPNSYLVEEFLNIQRKKDLFEELDLQRRKCIAIIENSNVTEDLLPYYNGRLKSIKKQLDKITDTNKLLEKSNRFSKEFIVKFSAIPILVENCCFLLNSEGEKIPFFDKLDTAYKMLWINRLTPHFTTFYFGYRQKYMRRIARSPYVMNMWRVSSNSGNEFFGGPVTELSPIQKDLCFYCDYYTSVFKNLGSPPGNIIEDDEAFDRWVDQEMKERSEKASSNNNVGSGNSKYKKVNKHKITFANPTRATSAKSSKKG